VPDERNYYTTLVTYVKDYFNRWDEFCMSPLASQRSMKTGSGLTMLCQDVWSRGLRPYWCFRARGWVWPGTRLGTTDCSLLV